MKENQKQILAKIYYGLLIFCVLGLVLACIGIAAKQIKIYNTGLIMASPLYMTVFPVLVFLIALTPVAGIWQLVRWLLRKSKQK